MRAKLPIGAAILVVAAAVAVSLKWSGTSRIPQTRVVDSIAPVVSNLAEAAPVIADPISDAKLRTVHVTVPNGRIAGGSTRKNDCVDVYFTVRVVADMNANEPIEATAQLARGVKIVAREPHAWPYDDASTPIAFTLQANPYRAALIEYAKNFGWLALVPAKPRKSAAGVLLGKEELDEEQHVINIVERGYPVTKRDLENLFDIAQLKWSRRQTPPVTPPLPVPPLNEGERIIDGTQYTTVPCSTCPGGKKRIAVP